jgi:hypothetical protein
MVMFFSTLFLNYQNILLTHWFT